MTADTTSTAIQEEAACWVEQLHDGEPCDAVMAAFDEWMNQSQAHTDAYFVVSDQYYELDLLDTASLESLLNLGSADGAPIDTATPSTAAFDATAPNTETPLSISDKLSSLPTQDNIVSIGSRRPLSARFSSVMKTFSVAASLVACVALGQTYLFSEKADLMSSTGEVAMHELEDSSTVHMNANSLLNVSMDEHGRNLELLKGEAYFTVAKDALRPFTVHANGAQIKALGTEFVVYNRDSGLTRVSVYESSVEVYHPTYMKEPRVIATGETISFGPKVANPVIAKLSKNDEASWREGRLTFNNVSLEDVITELNQHHKGKIILGKGLGNVRISGVFHNIDSLRILNDIVETQNLSSMNMANRVIYVYR